MRDERPLRGQHVVVCRANVDAGPLIERLNGFGATVVSVPLVEPVPPPDGGAALAAAVQNLSDYAWVVTTSANGSRAVLQAMTSAKNPAEVSAPSPAIACVGATTANVFTDAGLAVRLQASVSSAAGLIEQFPPAFSSTSPDEPKQRVLAPLACLASDQLQAGLQTKGYEVSRVDAYDTVAAAVDDAKLDAIATATSILFTSSSTVDRFVEIIGADRIPDIAISIGPKTSETMRRRGVEPAIEATNHNQNGVIEALCRVVSTMDR